VTDRMAESPTCWGIFREPEHSPGRKTDDAEILRSTGRRLECAGATVAYRRPESLTGRERILPVLAFSMCEGPEALQRLREWERRGVCVVNGSDAVFNTQRERTIALFAQRAIPSPQNRLLDCSGSIPRGEAEDRLYSACWVKQATEHKTREGDVVFATDAGSVRDALDRLRSRGLPRAVLQQHVDGDLVKFYGVSDAAAPTGLDETSAVRWFEWFYPKEHPVAGHTFEQRALREIARRAANALGLDVWGGDAIVTPTGQMFVIDLNAWPSFALFRESAAQHIAEHLEVRLRRLAGVAV
jgi:hypothetical protein